ncbi:2-dehydropantoate 2-reductase [Xylophilus sp.]|uniref:2-dehydropantoate 2-reductase n=1 Tax=Xylophilus sp. TaxID=2653893 RepID=UPI0013BDC1EF|nr:2-dehydropantoate 2-reductase [Xylophilus sp.]KAF1050309.1 MAG: 2-dehydropantoate 2-reductase [Xylophilus sp.]
MKVCIYGAGAIGGWIGARLAQAGHAVSAVARGATLEALRRHGLQLASPDGDVQAAVQAHEDPAALGVQDLVIIAVKAPALPAVAARIAPLLGPRTVVLTAMNGVPWWFFLSGGFGGPLAGAALDSVDPGGAIALSIPVRHVVGGVVHAACAIDGPGRIRHVQGRKVIVGEPAGGESERVLAISAVLTQAGLEAPVSSQIQKDAWYKLWGNMTMNPISALTGVTMDRILDDDLVRGLVTAVMLEARAVGERIGVPIAERPEDRHAVTRRLGAVKTSMLQDVEAGRPVELDALVAAVREIGQRVGVATPFTDALLGLARLKARGLGLY